MASVGGAFGHNHIKRHRGLLFVAPASSESASERNILVLGHGNRVARDTPEKQPVGHTDRTYTTNTRKHQNMYVKLHGLWLQKGANERNTATNLRRAAIHRKSGRP